MGKMTTADNIVLVVVVLLLIGGVIGAAWWVLKPATESEREADARKAQRDECFQRCSSEGRAALRRAAARLNAPPPTDQAMKQIWAHCQGKCATAGR